MKYFLKAVISSAALFFTCHVFAATQANEVNCPSISTIQKSIFTQAKYKEFIGWDMTSNTFDYQGKEWNIMLGLASIDDVKDSSEALKKGQAFFNSLSLHEPTQKIDSNRITCFYAATDYYIVVAATPAINLESFSLAR